MSRLSSTAAWRIAAAALVVAASLVFAAPELARAGYTPDEEFTVFAVRGINASGLPLLPSGLLYDRGVAYSYAAWVAGGHDVDSLVPARALSIGAALVALAVLWFTVRSVARESAAWLALALVATSLPFWAVASSARFYAPFLACYLGALAVLAGMSRRDRPRIFPIASLGLLVVLAAMSRGTHELAFTLPAVPAVAAVLTRGAERAKWTVATLAVLCGLAAAQVGILLLHFVAPDSGGTMIRRFFLWQVLNLFERPMLATVFGGVPIVGLAVLLIAPAAVVRRLTAAGGGAALPILAGALAAAAMVSPGGAFDYPLDLFRYIARTMPAPTIGVLGLLVARAQGVGGAWTPGERSVHLLWLGWATFFGVIDSGITLNYLLVPVTLMLTGLAIDLAAIVEHNRRTPAVVGTAVAVIAALTAATWGRDPRAALAEARPTIVVPDAPALRRAAANAALVACTDELACLLLVDRVDRWLALDDFLRQRFIVSRESGEVGVYAGTPAVSRLSALFDRPGAGSVLVIDVFKDLPVGSSSVFLPRALAADGLSARSLVDTPHLRVVELGALATPRVAGGS